MPGAEPPQETAKLEQTVRSGANWFYWIAGLSIVNSAFQLFGSDRSFIVGLGITQVFDAIASEGAQGAERGVGLLIRTIAFAIDLLMAGLFVLLAWQANKRRAWAFILGMLLYFLDGLIFLLVRDWLSFGFHGFALFGVWTGYSSLRKLESAEVRLGARPIEP